MCVKFLLISNIKSWQSERLAGWMAQKAWAVCKRGKQKPSEINEIHFNILYICNASLATNHRLETQKRFLDTPWGWGNVPDPLVLPYIWPWSFPSYRIHDMALQYLLWSNEAMDLFNQSSITHITNTRMETTNSFSKHNPMPSKHAAHTQCQQN